MAEGTVTQALRDAIPPGPECEPYAWCPMTGNGAYHANCLWHEGGERTCTCSGLVDHGATREGRDRWASPDLAAMVAEIEERNRA